MSESRFMYRCALLSAILLWLASIIHLLNINEALVGIKTGDIARAYAPTITGMWIFGGVSMFLLGVWIIALSGDLKKRNKKAIWQASLIGISLTGFGSVCWLLYPSVFHFLYFLLPGALLLMPVLFSGKKSGAI